MNFNLRTALIRSAVPAIAILSRPAMAQGSPDYTKAPNSYVFDITRAAENNYTGISIPVKKAYAVWGTHPYFQQGGTSPGIPGGPAEAILIWEDVPGLVSDIALIAGTTPEEGKIRAKIMYSRGKGNAVVGLRVNGQIYWSWHIWATDDPSGGVVYGQGRETTVSGTPFSVQWMDRNLGAGAADFLGHNWHKTAGLMYEWGRKDPFPPLVFKDDEFYGINSFQGTLYHRQLNLPSYPQVARPANDINSNIQYATQNPLTYIYNTDTAQWFSSSPWKDSGTAWDLWADNYRGGPSNGSSSNTAVANDSWSYELKSAFDPCPDGWRVPSHYGRVSLNNNHSPWGRKNSGGNDDVGSFSQLTAGSQNAILDGIKVYPGLGMDFTLAQGGARNIGLIPISGNVVYYPNAVAPNSPVFVQYQDQNANGALWSATMSQYDPRVFYYISDPQRTDVSPEGKHAVYINQTNPSKTGNSVRCIKDPNQNLIGTFPTEYMADGGDFRKGLRDPNSYLITQQTLLEIPVSKAFSVYNQILTSGVALPADNLVAKVLWTTNPSMITGITLNSNAGDPRLSTIKVNLNPNERGNAVISLHRGDTATPAYWSWYIWNPEGDPTRNTITYLTEKPKPVLYNLMNVAESRLTPFLTTFMDRNLGAVYKYEYTTVPAYFERSRGLNFQWGRKDPIPVFNGVINAQTGTLENVVFLGSENQTRTGSLSFTRITEADYRSRFTQEFSQYNGTGDVFSRARKNLLFSVQNPLTFLYRNRQGSEFDGGNKWGNNDLTQVRDWISEERGLMSDRWGHATEKSVFDPCPEGWRVPDVTYSLLYGYSKGSSPFYNGYVSDGGSLGGVDQSYSVRISDYYKGQVFNNGYVFSSKLYPLGNFAKDGVRGLTGGNALDASRTGVWTASLSDWHTGFGLGMVFNGNYRASGTGVYPQAGLSVRCAQEDNTVFEKQKIQFENSAPFINALISPNLNFDNKK